MAGLAWTHTTLKQALQYWLVEQTTSLGVNDFTANIDTVIKLGELKLVRDIDLDIFDTTESVNTTAADEAVTKPTGCLVPRSIHYTSSGVTVPVLPRSYDYVKDYGGVGSPLYYAEKDTTTWILAPVSASQVTLTVRHIKRPVSIVDTSPSWLGTNAPDALLYACLIASEEFLKDNGQLGVWTKKYEEDVLPRTKEEFKLLKRSNY